MQYKSEEETILLHIKFELMFFRKYIFLQKVFRPLKSKLLCTYAVFI